MKERFKLRASVYVILEKEGKTLLMQRAGSGYMDGFYSLPAGHVDGNETFKEAAIREAKEEINIDLSDQDLELILTMHRQSQSGEYVDVFFKVLHYENQIRINEPDKCHDLSFYALHEKEECMVPYIKQALLAIRNGQIYAEADWDSFKKNA